ncbi:MAG: hypothetical protein AAGJ88_00925 [Pseudomonadota bacterium]
MLLAHGQTSTTSSLATSKANSLGFTAATVPLLVAAEPSRTNN